MIYINHIRQLNEDLYGLHIIRIKMYEHILNIKLCFELMIYFTNVKYIIML